MGLKLEGYVLLELCQSSAKDRITSRVKEVA